MSELDRLAGAVRDRRLAMGGKTQSEAASMAGVSDTTWNQVETGKAVNERSLAKISQALWNDPLAGSRILEGQEPPDVAAPGPAPAGELLRAIRELTEAVRDLRADLREGRR